jgi:hypothetical protein
LYISQNAVFPETGPAGAELEEDALDEVLSADPEEESEQEMAAQRAATTRIEKIFCSTTEHLGSPSPLQAATF